MAYHHPRFWRPVWATPATVTPAKWRAVGVDNTILNPAISDMMRGQYSAIEVRLCNNQIVTVRRRMRPLTGIACMIITLRHDKPPPLPK